MKCSMYAGTIFEDEFDRDNPPVEREVVWRTAEERAAIDAAAAPIAAAKAAADQAAAAAEAAADKAAFAEAKALLLAQAREEVAAIPADRLPAVEALALANRRVDHEMGAGVRLGYTPEEDLLVRMAAASRPTDEYDD